MKKLLVTVIVFFLSFSGVIKAQLITVKETIQEYDQWCWAGCTKCVLNYYGIPVDQCAIADYARTVITWRSFGTANCCVDASQGCNYWNYMYSTPGSMQDIVAHFGNITTNPVTGPITSIQISTEIASGRPFIFRWGWNSGGGHFLVGHGIDGNYVNYMNPWFGEGLHIASRDWLINDGTHTWTHTNLLTTPPPPPPPPPSTGIDNILNEDGINIYPNPGNGKFTINFNGGPNASLEIMNVLGEKILNLLITNNKTEIDLSSQPKGIYLVKVNDGKEVYTKKVVIQ